MQLYSDSDEYKYIQNNYQTYWESCWKEEDSAQLQRYLEGWKNYHGREIEILKEHQVKTVCDAACGFEKIIEKTKKCVKRLPANSQAAVLSFLRNFMPNVSCHLLSIYTALRS